MKNIEKRISGVIIGSIFPLSLGLLSVTIWFLLDRAESRPLIYLITGILIGVFIDLKFLKDWIHHRFNLPIWIIVLIYLVYNVFVYGFFMGLPVFNVFLGLLAGYYFGNRVCFNNVEAEKHKKLVNQVSLFAGLVMALVCIPSGFLALMNYGAAGMIKDMLGLDFEITNSMIWGIVLIGGFILVLTNILLTRITMIKTIKSYNS
ncbi:MAG TPA: hypothetical protein VIH57_09965 [Bacteroidales bacterium]